MGIVDLEGNQDAEGRARLEGNQKAEPKAGLSGDQEKGLEAALDDCLDGRAALEEREERDQTGRVT